MARSRNLVDQSDSTAVRDQLCDPVDQHSLIGLAVCWSETSRQDSNLVFAHHGPYYPICPFPVVLAW
ncbi:hypothetical protein CY34DRAFT_810528 [Suillus luteus UH-Slu-Lm8-n1]|uniref:Uncharacterized protein n=1 Tax=Suillus luteus UH-Slu-Lm8-n1 TaxID=930992 RepID=A0A0D0AZG9_9AGAM|nr:hypothetical protein CY34DRAFT_810528 [Suillus luteus UH-Slu-Lm8-n1]